ncbi:MAG TPA: ATP-binding protein, partial [Bradyrhizobium sp.]
TILNLLHNAADACEAGGGIWINFGAPTAESDARQFHLVVRDSGPGIPPQILERIFNPFFTTKDHGTGLGLAIVHRIVEAHDGTIIVTNPPGGGAKFEIRV